MVYGVHWTLGISFEDFDLLVTPTTAHAATYDSPDDTVEFWMASIFQVGPFTAPFSIGGQSTLSLPLGQPAEGLPIGVQLVTEFGRDDLLLQLAARLEEAMPWSNRRPNVFAGSSR